jgi:hypothetical protein
MRIETLPVRDRMRQLVKAILSAVRRRDWVAHAGLRQTLRDAMIDFQQRGATSCIWHWPMVEEIPPSPKCKHGLHECPRCGQRFDDFKHTTVRGKGRVGRL